MYDGLVQVMVIAQHAQGRRHQVDVATLSGGQAKPAGREDAKDIAVREQEHIARTRTDPANHAIRAVSHRVHGFPPWCTRDVADVARALKSGPDGLARGEAAARLERYGPNQLEEAPLPSALAVVLHQFKSPLVHILLFATVATVLLAEYIDSAVIPAVLVLLVLNAVIGFTQERRAEESVRSLMKLVGPRARAVREGREWEIASRELVPDDLALLESGARVPVELRLDVTTALRIDESLLASRSEAR
jgi:magnesium-transporting ATPase (P-type)